MVMISVTKQLPDVMISMTKQLPVPNVMISMPKQLPYGHDLRYKTVTWYHDLHA